MAEPGAACSYGTRSVGFSDGAHRASPSETLALGNCGEVTGEGTGMFVNVQANVQGNVQGNV